MSARIERGRRRRAERSFGYRAVSIGAALILFLKEHNNISLSQVFLFFIQLLPALLHLAMRNILL
jgi:hypothetical protein